MTLSNFDWTDKDSVKWFIMLPTGHVGPYSIKSLIKLRDDKKILSDAKIWSEGLSGPVTLGQALDYEEMVDLPPLPEDEIPPLPHPEEEGSDQKSPGSQTEVLLKKKFQIPVWVFVSIAVICMIFFVFGSLVKNFEKFNVARLPKMTLKLHERILSENEFGGWDKKIFFKEYLPDDHSHIWLVTASFQQCQVEATFNSIKDKMLSVSDEKISFKTKGELKNHIVEFASFDFIHGSKIVPGLYEMDVRASDCNWNGITAKMMNAFSSPDESYIARTKVVLFSQGAEKFNEVLDRLIKKKMEVARKEQNQNEIFWQDLQQKLETLQAITLQIEQHMLDFLDENPASFNKNLKPMVDKYTRQFGSFLTSFVIENENYFKNLNPEAKGASKKRNYELMVRLTSKRIGLETMKFIEEFQSLKKNPVQKEVVNFSERLKRTFVAIKKDINQKIIQVSEDRSK